MRQRVWEPLNEKKVCAWNSNLCIRRNKICWACVRKFTELSTLFKETKSNHTTFHCHVHLWFDELCWCCGFCWFFCRFGFFLSVFLRGAAKMLHTYRFHCKLLFNRYFFSIKLKTKVLSSIFHAMRINACWHEKAVNTQQPIALFRTYLILFFHRKTDKITKYHSVNVHGLKLCSVFSSAMISGVLHISEMQL